MMNYIASCPFAGSVLSGKFLNTSDLSRHKPLWWLIVLYLARQSPSLCSAIPFIYLLANLPLSAQHCPLYTCPLVSLSLLSNALYILARQSSSLCSALPFIYLPASFPLSTQQCPLYTCPPVSLSLLSNALYKTPSCPGNRPAGVL